jgi:hypothetical protein
MVLIIYASAGYRHATIAKKNADGYTDATARRDGTLCAAEGSRV